MNAAKKILLVAVALGVTVALAIVFLAEPILTAALTSRIAAKSGLSTRMTTAHFDFWPNLRIRILGLKLSNPDHSAQEPVFIADELSFGLSYAALLRGAININDFSMTHPVLRVEEARRIAKPANPTASTSNQDVALSGAITITDGVIIDENTRRHATGRIDAITLRAQETHEGALALSLDARVLGKNIHTDGKAASAADLLAGHSTKVDVVAAMEPRVAGPLSLHAALRATGAQLSLDDVSGTWPSGRVTASADIRFDGEAPAIKADIHVDRLDLGTSDSTPANSSNDPAALSETAVDFKSLRLFDAMVDFRADELRAGGLRLNNVGLKTTLDAGTLRMALGSADLYQGKASGSVLVDATQDVFTQNAKFALAGVKAAPLLIDLANIKQFDGTLQTNFDLTSNGDSVNTVVANLAGSADLSIKDGVVTGHEMPDLFRQVSPYLPSAWRDLNNKITVNAISASFAVARGTASTQNIHILSPVADITGKGTIDLVDRTLDLRFDPKVTAGSGSAAKPANMLGLGAAILVRGPWSNPQISADLSNLMNNPQEALDKLQGLGQQFLGSSDKSSQPQADDVMKGINNLLKGFTNR
jgi:uncharacterized protein involved in outer membrane biogenesis